MTMQRKRRRAFVARRSSCGKCGKLVPSDSGLACKVVVTTGGRTLIGRLRRAGGRAIAVPQVFCIGCAAPALEQEVAIHERRRNQPD